MSCTAPIGRSTFSLPQLSHDIPNEVYIPNRESFAAPLAIALLEANLITDRMLRPSRNQTLADVFAGPDERDISMQALSKWWRNLIRENSCKFFRWNLTVSKFDTEGNGTSHIDAMTAFFCFSRQNSDLPRFSLARRAEQLEARLQGFGQTVLAVLFDACLYLPESFTLWRAVDWAEYLYWQDSTTDAEMIENYASERGLTQDEVENYDLLTREKFFGEIPRWAAAPARVHSREVILSAARNDFERAVINACDNICELVNQPDFTLRPYDKGAHRAGVDSVDACMALLWKDADVAGRVIDEWVNSLWECGEGTEHIEVNPVQMTPEGIGNFQRHTAQTLQLAVLTEKLILLIGEKI